MREHRVSPALARSLPTQLADDGGDDLGIAEELRRRPVGEHLAALQRDDAARVLGDQVHVVLDEDDRLDAGALRAASISVAHDAVLVAAGHAAGGLVEQDHLGRRARRRWRCRAASSRPARAGATSALELAVEPEDRRDLAHARCAAPRPSHRREEAQALAGLRDHRDGDGLARPSSPGKMCTSWNARAMPRLASMHRTDAGDVVALEANDARGGLEQPGEHVHQRRLAGAVRARRSTPARLRRSTATRRRARRSRRRPCARRRSRSAALMRARTQPSTTASCASAHETAREAAPRSAPGSRPARSASTASSPISSDLRKMNVKAPTSGPKKLANPPSTVMNTSSPECVQYASSGSAWPVLIARITPPIAQ